jgi:CBS-domain-containing membrane protein
LFLTIVLIYDAYESPLAQPRNVIGGFLVSSFIGVTARIICGYIGIPTWVTGAFAVCLTIVAMNITKIVHPPGGACALTAVIGSPMIHALGYGYVLTSVGAAFIMVAFAILGNNVFPTRQYPLYWY